MSPKPLQLRRRRWTLFFSVPFAVLITATFLYSAYIAVFVSDRLVAIIAACAAFGAFCVGGTFVKTVFEALYNLRPAVVLDSQGLHDLRGGTGLLPWHSIEGLKLDMDEQRILVNLLHGTATRGSQFISTTRRLVSGADHVIALDGLHYNPLELKRSLAEHHRMARGKHVGEERGNA